MQGLKGLQSFPAEGGWLQASADSPKYNSGLGQMTGFDPDRANELTPEVVASITSRKFVSKGAGASPGSNLRLQSS